MNTTTNTPRVYVGTYAKYNDGSIEGEWIDLEGHDAESFHNACLELHKDEADPELMFQDFEGFPREYYGESGLDPKLWDWLQLSEEDQKLLSVYCAVIGDDADIDKAREAFSGTANSPADFCEQLADDTSSIPKDFPSWIIIDWEATWKCSLRFDYVEEYDSDTGQYYFFNRNI